MTLLQLSTRAARVRAGLFGPFDCGTPGLACAMVDGCCLPSRQREVLHSGQPIDGDPLRARAHSTALADSLSKRAMPIARALKLLRGAVRFIRLTVSGLTRTGASVRVVLAFAAGTPSARGRFRRQPSPGIGNHIASRGKSWPTLNGFGATALAGRPAIGRILPIHGPACGHQLAPGRATNDLRTRICR